MSTFSNETAYGGIEMPDFSRGPRIALKDRAELNLLENLQLEAKLTLDISAFAHQIELRCADYLLPAPKGMYLKNRLEPVMVDGHNYYVHKGLKAHLIKDINLIKETVYDEFGQQLIPQMFMLNKAKYLSNTSFLPYRGAKLAEMMVVDQMRNACGPYHFQSAFPLKKMLGHMVELPPRTVKVYRSESEVFQDINEGRGVDPIHEEDTIVSLLEDAYRSIRREVALFIGNNVWNIYIIKLVNTTVTMERFMDYRAYQWELEHGTTFRKGRSVGY